MLLFLLSILFVISNAVPPCDKTPYSLGTLDKGVLLWARDCDGKPIPMSTTVTYNGTATIQAFCDMFTKFPNTCQIGFAPFKTTCN